MPGTVGQLQKGRSIASQRVGSGVRTRYELAIKQCVKIGLIFIRFGEHRLNKERTGGVNGVHDACRRPISGLNSLLTFIK